MYTWNEGWGEKFTKKIGVPRRVETLILSTLNPKSPGKWSVYIPGFHEYPPTGEYAFPEEIYFEVPANNKITFDFTGWGHNTRVVSEHMLQFLIEQGLTENYEIARAKIINRRGELTKTEKNYFVLWFHKFDDDLLEFNGKIEVTPEALPYLTSLTFELYPNMQIKNGVDKKIFVVKHRTFNEAFVFTEEVRDLIVEKKFIGANIYAMDELWQAYVDKEPKY